MRNRKRLATALAGAGLLWVYAPAFQPAAMAAPADKAGSSSIAPAAKVLDPEKFFGDAQVGYQAAQQCPEIIAKLFCYCGCDISDSHTSLLDCFTTDHGADC